MTEILGEGPDDVEEVLIAWLSGLGPTAVSRRPKDPLPFRLVRNLGGDELFEIGLSDPLVTVRTLCDKRFGEDAAADECDHTHRRVLLLGHELGVTLSGGRTAAIDYIRVVEAPHWIDFPDEQVLCKLARYQLGLTYTQRPVLDQGS